MRKQLNCGVALGLMAVANGFAPLSVKPIARTPFAVPRNQHAARLQLLPSVQDEEVQDRNLVERVCSRLDTLDAAGLKSKTDSPQYQIGFKQGLILAALAFGYKWYRARFVNKIPVWDRQPQWNTVVTTKEQEKELKAYTCKNCGSTIFIARHRGWFFEGTFGLGGLGCYTCGAKGKDNFVMDRDRILEDVKDIDDYFDYERPLDFVSAAERRKLMKQAGGDEKMANKMLVDQASESSVATVEEETEFSRAVAEAQAEVKETEEEVAKEAAVDAIIEEVEDIEDEIEVEAAVVEEAAEDEGDAVVDEIVEEAVVEEEVTEEEGEKESVVDEAAEDAVEEESTVEEIVAETVDDEPEVVAEDSSKKKKESAPQPPPPAKEFTDDDVFDLLDS